MPEILAGRYAIEREIGRGGMGVVFLARDLRHDRDVAVKIFEVEDGGSEGADRFLQEIQIAARLSHPNILPLHDSGEDRGLLFYVMPYVPGENLGQRLEREGALPVPDALTLAGEIAGALAYAHSHGVIHRDIKPANVLFISGHAVVADFGIARAISAGGWEESRLAGMPAGTPTYMSPEQARGGSRVDGRSDIYSLGCVLYEMLTGDPPFRGTTPEELAFQHLQAEPLPVQARRPALPQSLQAVVGKALAKHPADRYQTAQQMSDALARLLAAEPGAPPAPVRTEAEPVQRRRWFAPAFAAVAIALALFWSSTHWPGSQLNPSLVMVAPFAHRGGAAPMLLDGDQCSRLVRQALSRWEDVNLADSRWTTDQVAQLHRAPSLEDLLGIARRGHAGQLLSGEVWSWADSIRVRGVLYDVRHAPRVLREQTVTIRRDLSDAESRFGQLVDSLLLPRALEPVAESGILGTRLIAAWQAYDSGHAALAHWDLPAAERHFEHALALDPDYGYAHAWLAQTRDWEGQEPAAWRGEALAATEATPPLPARDRAWIGALLALGEGRYQDACARYESMIGRDSLDFRGWFGRAECRAKDRVVLRNAASETGWRFRSSYQGAIDDYQKALTLIPSVYRAFRGAAFDRLTRILVAEPIVLRVGVALEPDSTRFFGVPVTAADSIIFLPLPQSGGGVDESAMFTRAIAAATRGRRLLRGVTQAWVRAFPHSADAMEAAGRALEMVGELSASDPSTDSALRMYRQAAGAAANPEDRLRFGIAELRTLVKLGAFADAKALADSLVRSADRTTLPGDLAGVAVLTGRIGLAAELQRREAARYQPETMEGQPLDVPLPLRETALALEAFAGAGGPPDSLQAYLQRAEHQLRTLVGETNRAPARWALLQQAYRAIPPGGAVSVPLQAPPRGDYLLQLQARLQRGDTAGTRAGLRRLEQLRRGARPGDVAIEATLQEVMIQLAVGDTAAATRQLDGALAALPTLGADLVTRPLQAGALVRAMILRAHLGRGPADSASTRRWASSAATLWASADPPLQPEVQALRRLAGGR